MQVLARGATAAVPAALVATGTAAAQSAGIASGFQANDPEGQQTTDLPDPAYAAMWHVNDEDHIGWQRQDAKDRGHVPVVHRYDRGDPISQEGG